MEGVEGEEEVVVGMKGEGKEGSMRERMGVLENEDLWMLVEIRKGRVEG